eukprot:755595-Hanusia_phi.AAC.2
MCIRDRERRGEERRAGKGLTNKQKVTRPELLACKGGSNGGLLVSPPPNSCLPPTCLLLYSSHLTSSSPPRPDLVVGNALTQRPDLFGAVLCSVPLLDLRRYHKLLAGASWMDEYGDPDGDDWDYLKVNSPPLPSSCHPSPPSSLPLTSSRTSPPTTRSPAALAILLLSSPPARETIACTRDTRGGWLPASLLLDTQVRDPLPH